MNIIKPSFEILTPFTREDALNILKHIELCGRVCYKSEDKITDCSAPLFVGKLSNVLKHHSVLEHFSVSVRFIVDRGVSHELVRHRIASFSQESTRYANYSKDKFNNELTFIEPFFFEKDSFKWRTWYNLCEHAENTYLGLIKVGASPKRPVASFPIASKLNLLLRRICGNLCTFSIFGRLKTLTLRCEK